MRSITNCFNFFAKHRVKLSRDRNTSLIVFRSYQIQPLVQKQSFVVNIHLKANENFFRIPDPQFQRISFHMNHMKNRFFPEVVLDIAKCFLNSLILLLSNSLHSEKYMTVFPLDWEVLLNLRILTNSVLNSNWMH